MFDPVLASNCWATASSICLSGATGHPGSASNAVALETGVGAAWVTTGLDSKSDLNKFCAGSHSKSSHDAGDDWSVVPNNIVAGCCVGAATCPKAIKALKSTKGIIATNRKEFRNEGLLWLGLHSIGRFDTYSGCSFLLLNWEYSAQFLTDVIRYDLQQRDDQAIFAEVAVAGRPWG
jgi:hypothetical protein